jgi:hypothetical protein
MSTIISTRPTASTTSASLLAQPGLAFKRLTLLIGALYFTLVASTNLVNFIATVGGYHWKVLNSGNAAYIDSITKDYSLPHRFSELAVLGALVVEGIGAWLFWRALRHYRGGRTGIREVWTALCWNVLVWIGFIVGTEVFVAYTSESPFRELLLIGLAMAVVIAVVPDDPGGQAA